MTKLELPNIPWVGGFFKPANSYSDCEAEKSSNKEFETEETDSDSFTMKTQNIGSRN